MTKIRLILGSMFAIVSILVLAFIWQNTTLLKVISCHRFIDDRLAHIDFRKLTAGTEEGWIDDHFLLNWKQLYRQNEGFEWEWQSLTKKFDLQRSDDTVWLEQFWRFSTVHIEDALRCLGEPDAYLSFGEIGPDAVLYTLSLLYEQQGYIVTAQYFYATPEPPPVTKDTPLFYIGFLPPATSKQIIAWRYDDILAEAVRPWPSDIRQVEVPTIYVR